MAEFEVRTLLRSLLRLFNSAYCCCIGPACIAPDFHCTQQLLNTLHNLTGALLTAALTVSSAVVRHLPFSTSMPPSWYQSRFIHNIAYHMHLVLKLGFLLADD